MLPFLRVTQEQHIIRNGGLALEPQQERLEDPCDGGRTPPPPEQARASDRAQVLAPTTPRSLEPAALGRLGTELGDGDSQFVAHTPTHRERVVPLSVEQVDSAWALCPPVPQEEIAGR